MNHPLATDIRGRVLRQTWPIALTVYAAAAATNETVSIDQETGPSLGRFGLGMISILIAFSYGYGCRHGVIGAWLGGTARPFPRLGISLDLLTPAGAPVIDAQRLLQGTAAVCLFTGAVTLVSQGSPSSVLVWAVSLTQGLGLAGGFAGTLLFDPLMASGIDWYGVFIVSCVAGIVLAAVILWHRPASRSRHSAAGPPVFARVLAYRAALANRQTWLCGSVAALLFAPMLTGGLTWSLAFLSNDLHLGAGQAGLAMGLVALGWLVGRPLVSRLADCVGQPKRVVFGCALVMIAAIAQITVWPGWAPPLAGLFAFGVASASTVIPYKMFVARNVRADQDHEHAAFKGLHLLMLALTGIVFHHLFDPAGADPADFSSHIHRIGEFWMATIFAAMILAGFLQEADSRASAGRAA